jgi:hypothetical protein
MFALAMAEGSPATHCPATAVRHRHPDGPDVLEGVAVAETYLTFFLCGGQFPGTEFISQFCLIHVLRQD